MFMGFARVGSADWVRFSFVGGKREKSRKSCSPTIARLRFKFGETLTNPDLSLDAGTGRLR